MIGTKRNGSGIFVFAEMILILGIQGNCLVISKMLEGDG